jgi:hypothetical protein
VPEADPAKTNSLLSKADLFEPAVEERNNLYTYYKCLFPRFRHLHRRFFVVLFSDMFFHLNLLWQNITPLHNQEGSEYSQQILDLIPASEVRLVSFRSWLLSSGVRANAIVNLKILSLRLQQSP